MNKFIFPTDMEVKRDTVLSSNQKFRFGKKTNTNDFIINTGKGQFATEIYKIKSGEIEFEAEVTRKDYPLLKAEVSNIIKANIVVYGDKFINDVAFAEKQLQKALKEKFACKSCSLVSLEVTKTIEGDFLVKPLLGKNDEKEILHLTSVEKTVFNYNNQELSK